MRQRKSASSATRLAGGRGFGERAFMQESLRFLTQVGKPQVSGHHDKNPGVVEQRQGLKCSFQGSNLD